MESLKISYETKITGIKKENDDLKKSIQVLRDRPISIEQELAKLKEQRATLMANLKAMQDKCLVL